MNRFTNAMETLKPRRAVTLQDVARAAGVAKATASYALSGKGQLTPETREAVLRAARELSFEPNPHALRLSNGRSENLVGLFSRHLDLGVGAEKLMLIQQGLGALGYRVPIYTGGYEVNGVGVSTEAGDAALLADLRRQQPRALICNADGLGEASIAELRRFIQEGGVVVTYDYDLDLDCDQVIFDREDNTYRGARHLLELGHREIGLYMPGAKKGPEHPRQQGYFRALREFGATFRPDWMFHGEDYEEGGAGLARNFLAQRERPKAMCVVNDDAAAAFVTELGRASVRVPEDLSVVSYDDLPIARYHPVGLTSVSQPVADIAESAVQLLCRRFENAGAPTRRVVVRGELKVRQSAIKAANYN